MKIALSMIPAALALAGCMTAAQHYDQLAATQDRALTVGVVQKNIKVGLRQSDVAVTLGAPNIVARDGDDRETWVYDRIATEASFSEDSGSAFANLTGNGSFMPVPAGNTGAVSVNAGGNYAKEAGAASVTQRTLTVVIRFDRANAVESVAYHTSTF